MNKAESKPENHYKLGELRTLSLGTLPLNDDSTGETYYTENNPLNVSTYSDVPYASYDNPAKSARLSQTAPNDLDHLPESIVFIGDNEPVGPAIVDPINVNEDYDDSTQVPELLLGALTPPK